MPMTQKEMIALLEKHGFTKVTGGKGSHVKMVKQGKKATNHYSKREPKKEY